MKLEINHTHRFGMQLNDLSQKVIAACPRYDGVSPEVVLGAYALPIEVKHTLAALPWGGERKYRWLYIRPQLCRLDEPDHRSGSFFHLDVDAVYRSVAPAWDEFRAMAVAFGDVAETEFIADPMTIDVPGETPKSQDYVTLAGILNPVGVRWSTHSPRNAQVAHYTTLDAHRAGKIRKDGWRLIVLGFETNAEPQEVWP
jgi:hypothetical protein